MNNSDERDYAEEEYNRSLLRDDVEVPSCDWYVLCENEAIGHANHPVLGWVAVCERCANRHELVVRLWDGTVTP